MSRPVLCECGHWDKVHHWESEKPLRPHQKVWCYLCSCEDFARTEQFPLDKPRKRGVKKGGTHDRSDPH